MHKYLTASGAMLVMLASASTVFAQKSTSQSVIVTNGAANPVPTVAQGTTTVAGTVRIDGTPTVTLGSGSTVGISGPVQVAADAPLPVRDVNHVTAYQAGYIFFLDDGELSKQGSATIPSGKTFVVEQASVQACLPTGQKLLDAIVTANTPQGSWSGAPWGGTYFPGQYQLDFTLRGPSPYNSCDVYGGTQPLRLYADAIQFNVGRSVNAFAGWVKIYLSGYLVDQP